MNHLTRPQTRPGPPHSRKVALSLSWLLCLSVWMSLYPPPASTAVLDPRTVHSATLHNGLRLIVCEDMDASVLSAEVIVRVGSADDPPGQNGMAHLLEHMLWSSARGEDPRRRIEEIGGVVNAGVLRDFTRFYLTVPAGNLELAVDALSVLVLTRDFPPETLLRECAIIEDESRGRLDQPRAMLNDLAFEEVYGPDHPYSHPTDGYPYTLRTIGPGGLSLFHQTWYVPNNIAVIFAGNVEFEDVRAAVDSAFGQLTPAPLPARAWPPLQRPPQARDIGVETSLDQTYLMASFVGPAAFERREVCASDLLATLLVHGSSGRLVQELKEKRQLVTSVGVDFLTQRDRALFAVWAVCRAEDAPAVKETIRAELRRLAREPIPPAEFGAARRLLAAGFTFANETPADRAATLAFYEAVDSYRTAAQYLPRVRLLTPADVAEVAAWYAAEAVWITLGPKEDNE